MRAPHWTRLMSNSVIRFHLPWLDCAGGALSTRRPQLGAGASSRRFSPERGSNLIHRSPIQRAADRVLRGKRRRGDPGLEGAFFLERAALRRAALVFYPSRSSNPRLPLRSRPDETIPREPGVVRRARAGFVKRQRTVWAYPSQRAVR